MFSIIKGLNSCLVQSHKLFKRPLSKTNLLIICLTLICNPLFANNTQSVKSLQISGVVLDVSNRETIPFAILHFSQKNLYSSTDGNGKFSILAENSEKIHLSVKYIGYQTLDTVIYADKNKEVILYLQPQNFALNEVTVLSQENINGNSTSKIERTAIDHIQASSFTDILQLLPGKGVQDPALSKANLITLRQAENPRHDPGNIDINTSLGTAFIIDDAPLSNEANLQKTNFLSDNTNTTSKGIDMRTISTDRIESVEIVRGIPSVKYGDLTAGMVKINMKTGRTPWEARIKTDLTNKLFSVGKGFNLPQKGGAINFDADYIFYNPDPRSDITSYKRLTLSTRYQNKINLSENRSLALKTNVVYTGSFDNKKEDADAMKGKNDYSKNSFNNLLIGTTGSLQNKRSFIKELNYVLSFQYTKETLERQHLISQNGVMPLSTSMVEGAFYANYLPNEYDSHLLVDGRPIHFNSLVDTRFNLNKKNVIQHIMLGAEYRYDKNLGKGQIYDLNFPPYSSTKSTRPRAFNKVPAVHKLSVFAQDELTWTAGEWKIYAEAGVRGTTLPGISKKYAMSNQIYWEPRLNGIITLPDFRINNTPVTFALNGGVGQFYKFPTQAQLYPENLYFDYLQLNYYSQQADLRTLHIRTYIQDPVNYGIKPALNRKFEIGFTLIAAKKRLDVTFFHERMTNGFSSNQSYTFHQYQAYNAASVDPSTITTRPSIEDFTYTNDTALVVYSKTGNNAILDKKGIEYTLNLGQIKQLYTNITINGAWFSTQYKSNEPKYFYPTSIINGKTYPYIGVYDYNVTTDFKTSQLNTNLFLDTHIPKLRMIFTTSLQTMWYFDKTIDTNNGLPTYYIDRSGQQHTFTENDAKDPILKNLVETYRTKYFETDREGIAMTLNLRLTKEIGNNLRMAFFVNRILTYLPNYSDRYGITVNRSVYTEARPFFGAEINIKL